MHKKTFKAQVVPSPEILPLFDPNIQNNDFIQTVGNSQQDDSSSKSISQEALIEAVVAAHLRQVKTNKKIPRSKVQFSPEKSNVHQKTPSRKKRKVLNSSSSSENTAVASSDEDQDEQTNEMRSKVKEILGTDPMVKQVSRKIPHNFNPNDGLQPPSQMFSKKISDLINAIKLDTPASKKKSKAKKSKHSKSKGRRKDSSSDSDSTSSSSTSSSDSSDSASNLRQYYQKLKKKGKLTSGRYRRGLPVVKGEEWPHEMINHALAGKAYTCEDLTAPVFVAGILNQIIESPKKS